ncbi:MAG TPA: hypothetical protein EYO84_00635 [Planctomycetes bacterium]|nr:hypothetical protein [Planctomycetota bacterium]
MTPPRVIVANRGEAAHRIIRTPSRSTVKTIRVHSGQTVDQTEALVNLEQESSR